MPKIVDKLTEDEQKIIETIKSRFSEEQLCAYFLTKTIRSQYQFDDSFIESWYKEIFDSPPDKIEDARRELVQAYTRMLMVENKYEFHLEYWVRQYQDKLITEIEDFFAGIPGK